MSVPTMRASPNMTTPLPVSTAPASFGLRMRSATTRPWSTATLLPQSSPPPAPPTEKASDAAMRPAGLGLPGDGAPAEGGSDDYLRERLAGLIALTPLLRRDPAAAFTALDRLARRPGTPPWLSAAASSLTPSASLRPEAASAFSTPAATGGLLSTAAH